MPPFRTAGQKRGLESNFVLSRKEAIETEVLSLFTGLS